MGRTEGNQWNHGPSLGFPCRYDLNKTKQTKILLVNPRMEKARGVDPRGPQIRVSLENRLRGFGMLPKLACGPTICMKVWCSVQISRN